MSIFSFFKRKEQHSLFSAGSGDSFESAVVINADDSFVGVQAEYAYVAHQCGEPQRDWKIQQQSLQGHDGKPYDVLVIAPSNGEVRTFYFNIEKFFGK